MYNFYSDEIIEDVRVANDIVDVVGEYVKLEKKGKDYFGLCPFHKEKTASFSVAPIKQIFYCFGCGKGGNVIQFIMQVENLEYIESIRFLADRARIQLPEGVNGEDKEKARIKQEVLKINTEAARFFNNELNSNRYEKANSYMTERRLSENTIRRFGIGYCGDDWDSLLNHLKKSGFDEDSILKSGLILANKKGGYYDRFRNRIIFPIFDIRGNIIGFGGRVIDNSMPKYINSPETCVYNKGKNLYALNFAKNSTEKRVLIVEGYMDVISLHQSGIINTVASLGTALTESQGRLIKKYAEEIIISYDSDTAGQAATIRGLDLLNDIGCNVKVLLIPKGKDPDEFVKKNGVEEFKNLIEKALPLIEYKIKTLKSQINVETTEGKIKFLNSIADVLSKVDNRVEREMYIKKLAKDYEISREAIESEVYRRVKPKMNFRTAVTENRQKRISNIEMGKNKKTNHIEYYEKRLLALICIDNTVYNHIKDRISLEIFTDSNNKEAAKIIFEKLESKKGVVIGELFNVVEDNTASELARIVQEECFYDDNNKAVLDIIKKMELYKNEKRQEEILAILSKGASNEEDGALKRELNTILLNKKKI